MARQTVTELRGEIESLQKQLDGLRTYLETTLVSTLEILDKANESVAHQLRVLKIETDKPLPEDDF